MITKKTALFAIVPVIGMLAASSVFASDDRCVIEPFGTTMAQGERSDITVRISVDKPEDTIDLRMGNLPTFVEGGFDKKTKIEPADLIASSKILLNAQPTAQTGSFMIPIEYTISGQKPMICQFSLVILKGETEGGSTGSIEEEIVSRTTDMNFFQKIWGWLSRLFTRT
jgi:hypothetical protein